MMILQSRKARQDKAVERRRRQEQKIQDYDSRYFDVPVAKYVFIGLLSLVVLFHVAALVILAFTT